MSLEPSGPQRPLLPLFARPSLEAVFAWAFREDTLREELSYLHDVLALRLHSRSLRLESAGCSATPPSKLALQTALGKQLPAKREAAALDTGSALKDLDAAAEAHSPSSSGGRASSRANPDEQAAAAKTLLLKVAKEASLGDSSRKTPASSRGSIEAKESSGRGVSGEGRSSASPRREGGEREGTRRRLSEEGGREGRCSSKSADFRQPSAKVGEEGTRAKARKASPVQRVASRPLMEVCEERP